MARSNLFPHAFNGVNLEKLIFQLPLNPKSLNLLDMVNLIKHLLQIKVKVDL